ncbi:MAG: hypothetical protein RI519_07390 [Balneolaceae bacterium]|nr:hypothetical protein [Balneolaceae bacterium]
MGKKKRLKKLAATPAKEKAKQSVAAKKTKYSSKSQPKAPIVHPLDRLDQWLSKHRLKAFIGIFIAFLITGIGLFDAYIMPIADDATYITQPLRLIEEGVYPSYTSVFYTVVMAIPAALFGVSILPFKAMSFIFGGLGLWLTYVFFKDRISATVLFATLFIYATNFEIQYYNSALMSESFFMAFQMLFFGLSLAIIDRYKDSDLQNFKSDILQKLPYWSLVGILFVLFSVTKNMALVCAVILSLFFALKGKFKIAGYITGLFVFWRIIYSAFVRIVFGGTTVTSQFDTLFLKNMYDPSQGNEDVLGMIIRYWQNFNYYLSDVLLRYLGFREDGMMHDPLPIFSVLFAVFCVFFIYRSFIKKDNVYAFTGLYLMGLLSVVFISLQFHWKQERQLIIFLPLIVLFVFGVLHQFAQSTNKSAIKWGVLLVLVSLPVIQLRHLPDRWERNEFKREAFLANDPIGGYTMDWQNYYRMSVWAAENLPQGSIVGVRKAASSFVFTGGVDMFLRVGKSTREPGNIVLDELSQRGITHLMACNLRLNPAVAVEGQIITTLYTYLQALYNYRSDSITPLHRIGETEPCTLYQINFE